MAQVNSVAHMPLPSTRRLACMAALIVAAGLAVYARIFDAPFIFDDLICIVDNPALHDPGNPAALFAYSPTRVLPLLTLALNYAVGGTSPAFYHLVNLLLHLACACACGLLVVQLTGVVPPAGASPRARGWAGAWAGAVFAVHPVMTGAVTYTWQRSALMCALGYLLGLICFIQLRAALDSGADRAARRWWLLCLVAGLVAALSKEVALSFPLALVLLSRCCFADARPLPVRMRAGLALIPLAVLLPLWLYRAHYAAVITDETEGAAPLTAWVYWGTQVRVTLTYLRLALWPRGLHLDHDVPPVTGVAEVLPGLVVLLCLVAGLVRLHRRLPLVAFGGGLFFVGLSVEAAAFQLPDVLFEHRMYLPMAGLVVLVAGLPWWYGARARRMVWAAPVLVAVLGLLTVSRNNLWRDPIAFWTDNLVYAPNKARVWLSRAQSYRRAGQAKEAHADAARAVALAPAYRQAQVTLGLTAAELGRHADAVAAFDLALATVPTDSDALNARGLSLLQLGRAQEALASFDAAQASVPDRPQTWTYRGAALHALGRHAEAVADLTRALAHPDAPVEALRERAGALHALGRDDEAAADYAAYLARDASDPAVHLTLARLQFAQGRAEAALTGLNAAIARFPTYAPAYFNRAVIYYERGRFQAVVDDLSQVLRLKPSGQAYYRRGLALTALGREAAAREDYRKAAAAGVVLPAAIQRLSAQPGDSAEAKH